MCQPQPLTLKPLPTLLPTFEFAWMIHLVEELLNCSESYGLQASNLIPDPLPCERASICMSSLLLCNGVQSEGLYVHYFCSSSLGTGYTLHRGRH